MSMIMLTLCYKNMYIILKLYKLTLILLVTTTPTFANSVDPDQMASEEAIWSGSTLFVMWFVNWTNKLYQVIWLVDRQKWVWLN